MIKIEVTGNSIPEVADKLLAIGASLRGSAIVEGARAAVNAMQVMEVAKAAPVDPTLNRPTPDASVTSPDTSSDMPRSEAPKSAPAAEAIDSQPTTEQPSSTPAPAASVSEELEVVDLPVVETPALDFNADIRTLALQLVKKRDKAALEKILIYFGVDRASQVEPARMPELLDMIKAALG